MLAMSSWVIMFLTKWLRLQISTTLPPCSKTQSNQQPNSGQLLITALSVHCRKNLRNSDYEEIFSAWEEWRWTEPPCLSEQSTFNSRLLLPPSYGLWANISWVSLRFHEEFNRYPIVSQWWLISVSVPSSLPKGAESPNLSLFCSVF